MIREFFAIFRRNLNTILNTKLSFLIIFLGPIILILVVGGVLQNTSLIHLNVGVYTANSSDLTGDKFISGFLNNLKTDGNSVYTEYSLASCTDGVLRGNYHACVEIVKNQQYQVIPNEQVSAPSYEIISHVDQSKTQTVWKIINTIQSESDKESYEIAQEELTSIVGKIDAVVNDLRSQQSNIQIINNDLYVLKTNSDNTTSKIAQAKDSLNLVNNNLVNLQNMAGALENSNPQRTLILTELENAFSNLNFAMEQVSDMQQKTSDINSKIDEISNEMNSVSSSINNIITQWDSIKQTDISQISKPVTYSSQPISSPESHNLAELGFIDYIFPTFLIFFVIFICFIFPTSIIIRERRSGGYIRNITSKTSGFKFVFSNLLSCIIIILVQVAVLLLISKLFIHADIISLFFPIFVLILISVSILSMVGVIFGYLFNSFESSMIASISFSLIILMLLPGITPTEMLPPVISPIVKYTLPVIMENKLRTLIIFGTSLSFTILEILSITALAILEIAAIRFLYKRSKRKEI